MPDEVEEALAELRKGFEELQDELIKMQIDLHAYRLERAILKEQRNVKGK